VRIYNLFPLLAGKFGEWRGHFERADGMGFNWVFVNPIQKPGYSGSLYSVSDYFALNPAFVDPDSKLSADDQFRATVAEAEALGLRMMADLVINHCAFDSPLLQQHPAWFVRAHDGSVEHPFCVQDNGHKEVWYDLAKFNHEHSSDREGLFRYFLDIVNHFIGLGFKGFRCDAAYQVPGWLWRRLISAVKQEHPDIVFAAETLGCQPKQTIETARAGFDYIFNSSKWWDFSSPWLMEQYELLRPVVPSISFPESHDTERLFQESGGNENMMKQRYLFAALFSAGVMMPMGYEYGFRKKLHVVNSRPQDWEQPAIDLTRFITDVNRLKAAHPVFSEESVNHVLHNGNPSVLLMWKAAERPNLESLIILNKDPHNRQRFYADNLQRYIQAPPPLKDVSVEWAQDFLSAPFEFELAPGMGRVLVTEP
jgi:starch synthase (maltosyl-transferring)